MLRPVLFAALVLLAAPAAAAAAPVATLPADMQVSESVGAVTIPVTLSEPSGEPVQVRWQTTSPLIADAPIALPDRDYERGQGTLEFPPGETRRELTITVLDDAIDDPSAFMAVELPGRPATAGISESVHILIVDDEPTPPASVAAVRVDESAGEAIVPVTRSAISQLGIALYAWRARPASAARADLAAAEGKVAIGYGTRAGEARVPIVDDAVREHDETFAVELVPWPGPIEPFRAMFPGPVEGALATVTIADDDAGARTLASIRRLRGLVKLDGADVATPLELHRGAEVDARRGAARLALSVGRRVRRAASIAGGSVRVAGPATMALVTPTLRIETARGMRFRGRTATASPAAPGASWTMAETAAGTRVRVRSGAVRAGGALVRAGRTRVFR